jgi:hypothetical protein
MRVTPSGDFMSPLSLQLTVRLLPALQAHTLASPSKRRMAGPLSRTLPRNMPYRFAYNFPAPIFLQIYLRGATACDN